MTRFSKLWGWISIVLVSTPLVNPMYWVCSFWHFKCLRNCFQESFRWQRKAVFQTARDEIKGDVDENKARAKAQQMKQKQSWLGLRRPVIKLTAILSYGHSTIKKPRTQMLSKRSEAIRDLRKRKLFSIEWKVQYTVIVKTITNSPHTILEHSPT